MQQPIKVCDNKHVKIEPRKLLTLPAKISSRLSDLGTPYRDAYTTFIFPASAIKKKKDSFVLSGYFRYFFVFS